MREEFSIFNYYKLNHHPDLLISYRGPVSSMVLREISRDIRQKFAYNRQLSRRVFAIYMELAQNILYYSSEKNKIADRYESVGTILLQRESDHYLFSCGNLIENQYLQEMEEKCRKINALAREDLREYKRSQRKAPREKRSRGAGIGLIQVALTSRHPIRIEFREINERHTFFALIVKISEHLDADALNYLEDRKNQILN